MKKFLAIILICALLLLMGCGKKKDVSDIPISTNVSKSEKETSQNDNDDKESLTYSPAVKTPGPAAEPADDEIVVVKDYIPDVIVDLRYSTTNNFTGEVIYKDNVARLRYGTVKKLMKVQDRLREKDLCILIWDAYRPIEAQFKLWEICPDPSFVANPNKGFSSHSRGNTIDITIADKNGNMLLMPSEFDEFNSKADRNYSDISKEAGENSQMLEDIMEECGFSGYIAEWWHYSDETDYPVVK